MGVLRLYRKFYHFSSNTGNYDLLTPSSLSASTYVAGSGHTETTTLIESSIIISQESLGVYYADLNPNLYSSDVTYDLVWYVNYTDIAPTKKLTTRFRIQPFNIANKLDYEISDSTSIDYEISDLTPIEYEIINIYN